MDFARKQATHLVLSEETPVNGNRTGYSGRSPIESLPDKVLARIFQAGVLGEADEDHDDEDDIAEGNASINDIAHGDDDDEEGHYHDGRSHHFHFLPFPVLVSHVCTRWRELALETPALWATLSFTRVTSLDRICAHIARSGLCPLSIFIDAYVPEFSVGSHTANSAIFRLLSGTMENGSKDVATVGGLPGYELEDGLQDDDDDDQVEVTSLRDFGNSNAANGTRQERLFLTSKDLFEIFELITPSVERWKEFHFDTNTYLYIPFILSQLSRLPESPLLERLVLFSSQTLGQHENDLFKLSSSTNVAATSGPKAPPTSPRRSSSISHTSSTPLPFAGKLSNLKKLALWGIPVDQWDRNNRLRFGPLTKLDNLSLSFQSLDALFDIISLATSVGTLALIYEAHRVERAPALPSQPAEGLPIALPGLHNLTLNRFGSDIAANFIRSIRAPTLQFLRFDTDPDKDGNYGHSPTTAEPIPQATSSTSLLTPSRNSHAVPLSPSPDYTSFLSTLTSTESGINPTTLETLEIHGLYCSDDVAFDRFVRKLTGLKTLKVEWDDTHGAEQMVRKLGEERRPEGGVFVPSLDNLSLEGVETSEQLRVVREALDSRHVLSGFKGFKSLTFP